MPNRPRILIVTSEVTSLPEGISPDADDYSAKAGGLETNPDAPVFFWPSRLDPVQKGCTLLAETMYDIISRYWDTGIQNFTVNEKIATTWPKL